MGFAELQSWQAFSAPNQRWSRSHAALTRMLSLAQSIFHMLANVMVLSMTASQTVLLSCFYCSLVIKDHKVFAFFPDTLKPILGARSQVSPALLASSWCCRWMMAWFTVCIASIRVFWTDSLGESASLNRNLIFTCL